MFVLRALFFIALFSFALLPGCFCDQPPASGSGINDDENGGGPEGTGGDGGVPGGSDGGDIAPLGAVWVHGQDGIFAQVDLETGQTTYPLGRHLIQGGLAHFDGTLYAYAGMLPPVGLRLIAFDTATFAATELGPVSGGIKSLHTDGTHYVAARGESETLTLGLLDPDDVEEDMGAGGDAVLVDDGVIFDDVGPAALVSRTVDDATTSTLLDVRCAGLFWDPVLEILYCAEMDGSAQQDVAGEVLAFERQMDGSFVRSVIASPGNDDFFARKNASITVFDDGSFVMPRTDCSFVTDSALVPDPDDVFGTLYGICPTQWVQDGGRLFFAERWGGIVEVVDGAFFQRTLPSDDPAGIASGAGLLVVAAHVRTRIFQVQGEDFEILASLEEPTDPVAVHVDTQGAVHMAHADGLDVLTAPTFAPVPVQDVPGDLVDLAAVDRVGYAAAESDGLFKYDLAVGMTGSQLSAERADRVAACEDGVFVVDFSEDAIFSMDAEGTRTLWEAAPADLVSLACVAGQMVIARDDGSVQSRPLDQSADWQTVTTLPYIPSVLTPAAP
jgi:hypothetical protein